MLKNNNGITIVTLVFTIIVVVLLATVFITTSLKSLEEARKSEIQNEIHALENAISDRYVSYLKNDDSKILIGESFSGDEESKKILFSYDDINQASGDILKHLEDYVRLIKYEDAEKLGVKQFKKESFYIVDYYTSNVFGPISKEDANKLKEE